MKRKKIPLTLRKKPETFKEGFEDAKRRLINKIFHDEQYFYWAVFVVLFALILGFDFIALNTKLIKPFWENVLIEGHGMLMDVVILGIVFSIYSKIKNQKEDIKRYQESIEELRNWHSEESMHRLSANIKRLSSLGVDRLQLQNCYFENAELVQINLSKSSCNKTNFENAILKRSDFSWAYLTDTNLKKANVKYVKFNNSSLNKANFEKASLADCVFDEAIIKNTIFNYADICCARFLDADLQNSSFYGAVCEEANFSNAKLLKCDFSYSFVKDINLIGAKVDCVEWIKNHLILAKNVNDENIEANVDIDGDTSIEKIKERIIEGWEWVDKTYTIKKNNTNDIVDYIVEAKV